MISDEPKPQVKSNFSSGNSSKSVNHSDRKKLLSKVIPVDKHRGKVLPEAAAGVAVPETKATATKAAGIIIDDPEYTKKMEEQKRKREAILKLKEDRRRGKVQTTLPEPESQIATASSTTTTKTTTTEEATSLNKRNVVLTGKGESKVNKKRLTNRSPTLMNVKQLINKTLQENNGQKRSMVVRN